MESDAPNETQSLLDIDVDESGSKAKRNGFLVLVVGLLATAAVFSVQTEKKETKETALSLVDTKNGELNGVSFSCSHFNDDEVYTAEVCGAHDYKQCFGKKKSCASDFWCSKLCGEMCDEGAGAICYFDFFSHIEESCDRVQEIRSRRDYDSIHDIDTDPEGLDIDPSDFLGYGLDTKLNDEGCARHSYCAFCDKNCAEGKAFKYIEHKYGYISVEVLKHSLFHVVQMCDDMGRGHDTA
jgi:hypothetical protein